VVSFTPLSLYFRGKNHRYPLDRRLGGPQIGLDAVEKKKKNLLSMPEIEPQFLGRPAPVAIPTEIFRLVEEH
jgi:hypothetical protein